LAPVISTLLQSSLQPSSLPTYQRAWKLFSQFLHVILPSVSATLPISPPVLALFIAHMYDRHYAPSTVSTYVSALGYCHKLSGFPDPTKVFFIVQMLKGYGKLGSRLDSRLPITLGLFFALQMVPLSYELYLLTSFPWPLSIAALTLPVIKVIAFVLVPPRMLLMLECLIRRLGL